MLNERPDIYKDVFLISSGSATQAAVGGIWTEPDLALSYLLSARYVIEASQRDRCLSEVALPAAYLQRHAMEVALKDILATVYGIGRYRSWRELLERDPNALAPVEKLVPFEHSLLLLRDALQKELNEQGLEAGSEAVEGICERLAVAENGAPDRYRYNKVKQKGKPLEDAFPEQVLLPVVEMQRDLEEVFERFLHFDPFLDHEQKTWRGRIGYLSYQTGKMFDQDFG